MALTIVPPADKPASSAGSALAIQVAPSGPRGTVIALIGEADVSNQRALSDALSRVIASRSGDVVIDLAQTTFIDTAIVRTLFEARQVLVSHGNDLTLRSPSRLAARILRMFGMAHLIEDATEADRPAS